jgi:DNA-nicking Smr family endonuclease
MARRGKRGLSDEDRALWERVAKTAKPLAAPARNLSLPEIETPRPSPALPRERISGFRIGEKARPKPAAPHPEGDLATRLAHAPIRMDHAAYRKLIRGKLKPDARIDLHGMTISQAHPALISFIFAAHGRGDRLVLVITGKGKDHDSTDPMPIRRGVLRHQVPTWLHTPPLGALVLDIREAHQRHGGGGAYYVYLRRPR